MTTYSATYSPEDNKIRLYASTRLDAETYARVKAAGFIWAPKQELFVAPKWTPAREDLAVELAGDIEPEEMTLAERAAIKAERLDNLASKRNSQANALSSRADELSQAFYMGQPILVGHHSERKARKTQERMHSAMTGANKAHEAANYWLYRASGVEHFANMKNNPKVRANRIKTLLAELRDLQRAINQAHGAKAIWATVTTDEAIIYTLGRIPSEMTLSGWNTYSEVRDGKITPAAARERCLAAAELIANGPTRKRWIEHVLNRLAFERSMLGDVPRYEEELTPVIIQAFAREHGAEKPKCTVIDDGYFMLESPVPLPAHLAETSYLELAEDEWRDLMRACGYIVPAKKNALPPILNIDAEIMESPSRAYGKRGETEKWRVVRVTKDQLAAVHNDARGVRPSACGQYRFKVASARHLKIEGATPWEYVAVFVTDSKVHEAPATMECAA